LIEIILISI